MYLKSLTLRGFKSFASATTFNFEPGITCVVGPNGSGKSNVVDALSWVMGEQGAKSLRGAKMEDVIFAGTSGRAALGRAEVVLTIDNTDGALPIEYAEVTIARTMFRHGGSEYAINGAPARLLDVQELLSDSGIGREMHVIVGQGQLDSILQATPESRRGFVEEAAGILKHRRRKEKAVRKIEATAANMTRLSDLLDELRRQLKPLARQADVAKRAAIVQADARDAKARLLADDYVQAMLAMESELADEQKLKERKAEAEAELLALRQAEAAADEAARTATPEAQAAQQQFYALTALSERISSTQAIARDRMRFTEPEPETRSVKDPDTLEAEAAAAEKSESALHGEIEEKRARLQETSQHRAQTEQAHAREETSVAAQLTAVAKQREAVVRHTGKSAAARSRAESSRHQLAQLRTQWTAAQERAEQAQAAFAQMEGAAQQASADVAVQEAYEAATRQAQTSQETLQQALTRERSLHERRAGLVARIEALESSTRERDGSSVLTQNTEQWGIRGHLAALIRPEPGFEQALAAVLHDCAEALVVDDAPAAQRAALALRAEQQGRASVVVSAVKPIETPATPPPHGRWALDVSSPHVLIAGVVSRALANVVIVDEADHIDPCLQKLDDVTVVTRDGDIFRSWMATGGPTGTSDLEVHRRIDDARSELDDVEQQCANLAREVAEARSRQAEATESVKTTLAAVKASEAKLSGITQQVAGLRSAATSSRAEAERLERQMTELANVVEQSEQDAAASEKTLSELSSQVMQAEPDTSVRDELAVKAKDLRAQEVDARLSLRTVEERARGLAGRAEALRKSAAKEREALALAQARREAARRQAERATAVHTAATWLGERAAEAAEVARLRHEESFQLQSEADTQAREARRLVREKAELLEQLVASVHRDELARAQQMMHVEAIAAKALDDLGIDAEILVKDYGPDQLIPVLAWPDGTPVSADVEERPTPVPFVREEQEKRLRRAEKQLQLLGKVNPLALEEFDAMQERHAFLASQLEDIRRTRADLFDIIADVDRRVEEVFAAAYADVEKAFSHVFARLFPGGEGRLVLTEPDSWLTTGVDVEARPAGKKIRRLSLLSGGERSLVAVAFLVSLFIARPSPFYILDEVEAALDDVNLGRLLGIYEELRENSQLLVITHQKRTMEIADALYGVTMRGDGVSTVISQRLHDAS